MPFKTFVQTLLGTKELWLGWFGIPSSSTALPVADPIPGGSMTGRPWEDFPTAHGYVGTVGMHS